jgi:GNAT superfamily N-acetyltransferase
MITIVRQATTGDAVVLARLSRFGQEVHLAGRPEYFQSTDSEALVVWYRSLLEDARARIWIAEQDRSPVGYLIALFYEAPENPFVRGRRWCEIDQLAVDPVRRTRGIARTPVLKAISSATAEGISEIEASSWCFNEGAHEMFRRLGFAPKTTRFELKSPG